MALFPPDFFAGLLAVFLQVRLKSIFSVASALVNGLSFFLPPDDELINRLNGRPAAPKGKKDSAGTPLSADEKMQQFYIRVAKTETGVFVQTLFFELYEMMVLLTTSALVACLCSDAVAYWRDWGHMAATSVLRAAPEVSVYGLLSVLLICLWFPLQVKFAQGLATYESRLGLGLGALSFIIALFVIFAPKQLFDFDLELATVLVGRRLEIVFRAVGFVDGDIENLLPLGETLRIVTFGAVAAMGGIFASTAFLPAFRFARMYTEMIKDKKTGLVTKLLLHLNIALPLIAGMCWIKPLSTDLIVPPTLVPCSPLAATRDCLADGSAPALSWHQLTETQWHSVRLYVVLLTIIVRVVCFRSHLQQFLVEPKDTIVQLVRRPGVIDGELIQTKVRIQFNYVPIIAIQYLAPVGAMLASLVLLARQTATSFGIFDSVAFALLKAGALSLPEGSQGLVWFASRDVLPDPSVVPQLGGFRVGDDFSKDNISLVVKGMNEFPVVTAPCYASFYGFLIWWFTFMWFAMTFAGFIYWKNVPHTATAFNSGAALATKGGRVNRETPKLLKNQLKGLKLKKH
ncbi:hypothetical protein PINS_up004405 [Pythium insidiosum]|nr:hypothetical protein PINS_up004405 [Pythium insidiosum]